MLRPMRVTSSGIHLRLDFWVAALLVGACGGLRSAALWAGTIFLSILIHELARNLVGRVLGYRGTMVRALTGPVASVACGLALVWLKRFVAHPEAHWLVVGAAFNLTWAAISLLPISGFDGGRLVEAWMGTRSSTPALLVSIFTTELTVVLAVVLLRCPPLGALLLTRGVVSTLGWIKRRRRLHEEEAAEQLLRADKLLDAGRYAEARDGVRHVLSWECGSATRNAAFHLQARTALRERTPDRAWEALQQVRPESAVDRYILAIVENALGRRAEAIAALTRLPAAALSQKAARMLVDLHALGGDLKSVAAAAMDNSEALGPPDLRRVADVLIEAGESELAVGLLRSSLGSSSLEPTRLAERSFPPIAALEKHGTR
jgi:tetratricopeptide (TPR) repeat protein